MKKAVAYLVPFMEKERAEAFAKNSAEGETMDENVSYTFSQPKVSFSYL